jgi:hypothetical protein
LAAYNSQPTLNNVTFYANTANQGGGVYNQEMSSMMLTNSILWGNTTNQIENDATSSATVSYSDVQNGYSGEGNLDTDPLLGPLNPYSGTVSVYPLLPGSPAIDTGDDAHCAAADGRGVLRPQMAHCDMGAFESRGFNLSVYSGDNQHTLVNTDFPLLLVGSISSLFAEPIDGGLLSFTAPTSGASAAITGSPAIISEGLASVSAEANDIAGTYQVTADLSGASALMNFHLSNTITAGILMVVPSGLASGTCSSWTTACELQYALTSAEPPAELWVKAGTYIPTDSSFRSASFILRSGVALYGGFSGTETARNQRNPIINETVLSGEIGTLESSDNTYHVVIGSGTDISAVLDGFTIRGGNASGQLFGGGMLVDSGNPTIIR